MTRERRGESNVIWVFSGVQGTHATGSDGISRWSPRVYAIRPDHTVGSMRSSLLRRTSGAGYAITEWPGTPPFI